MNLTIDREKYVIIMDGKNIDLPKKEFEVVTLLCSVQGKVFSRKIIFDKIWGEDSDSKLRTVDVHIVALRKKLGESLIRTIKGVGYKITERIKIKTL